MADLVDELVKEIAAKHGIAVGRDDPLMIFITVGSKLLEESAKGQRVILDHFKEELEVLSARWSNDARERAERIVGASLDASRSIVREGTREAVVSGRAEVDTVLIRVGGALKRAQHAALLNLLASCVTLLAAAMIILTAMR